jgi:hypothetical protein
MKKALLIVGLFLTPILSVSATSPAPLHPPAPAITATKAIEIATKFIAVDTNDVSYCSSVTLVEGGMTPPPRGSVRHWLIIFQDAGGKRTELRRVYVNMEGRALDSVPFVSN